MPTALRRPSPRARAALAITLITACLATSVVTTGSPASAATRSQPLAIGSLDGTGKVLGVDGTAANSTVYMRAQVTGSGAAVDRQRWTFELLAYVPEARRNVYLIRNVATGLCLGKHFSGRLQARACSNPPLDSESWHLNRYSWCAWGRFFATGYNIPTGEIIAVLYFDFTVIGLGNKGVRQFDYYVQLDNIVADGNINWGTSRLEAEFTECLGPEPSNTCITSQRMDSPVNWQLVNSYAATFISSEDPGAPGDKVERATTSLDLGFSTPAQPEWRWEGDVTTARTRERYDSATYVGSPRGAVFPDYPLVFRVDYRDWDEDESARHIYDALNRPWLTLPSWAGKTVPSRLTRMYDPQANEANRANSIAQCRDYYGDYNGELVNCDEYPFASTYQGSLTGKVEHGGLERHSVRLIDAADNQNVGRLLENNFFRDLRVLDGEQFDVRVDGLP